jgi:hypothetical protein
MVGFEKTIYGCLDEKEFSEYRLDCSNGANPVAPIDYPAC